MGLRALLVDVDELHRVNVPWMFREPTAEPRPDEFFERQLASDDSMLLVAEAGGQLVGVAAALMREAPDFALFVPQCWGVLDNIAVSPAWRRRGVGTALIRSAEHRAQARLEAAPSQHAYGRLALLHDPFGHGLCLLQFDGKGYDELSSVGGVA